MKGEQRTENGEQVTENKEQSIENWSLIILRYIKQLHNLVHIVVLTTVAARTAQHGDVTTTLIILNGDPQLRTSQPDLAPHISRMFPEYLDHCLNHRSFLP